MTTRRVSAKQLFMAWVMALACLGLLLVYPRAEYAVPAQDLEALDDPALAACHSQSFDLLTPADIPSDGPIGVPTDSNGEPLLTVSEDGEAVDNYIPLVMIAIGFDGQPYDDVPVAYRIDTPNEGEYYLIENRRFVSWEEGMGKFYPSAATSGGSEDRGGGLILWHIDDNIVDKHSEDGNPNYGKHHPGVMPLYLEEDWDTDDVWVMGG